MIIALLLILIIVPVATVALNRSDRFGRYLSHLSSRLSHRQHDDSVPAEEEDKESVAIVPDIETVFQSVMAKLQVTPSVMPNSANDADDDTGATFEYQGGHFVAMFRKTKTDPFENSMSISYFNCYSVSAEHVDRVGELANIVNNLMMPVKCTYADNPEEGDVSFSLHATGIRLFADDEASVEYMRSLLLCFFRLQRMLFERFESLKGNAPSSAEADRLIFGHQLYALSRMEVTEQPGPFADPLWHPSHLTVGEFVHMLFGVTIGDDVVMTVNGVRFSDNLAEISSAPLLASVVEGEGPDAKLIAEASYISIRSRVRENREILISLRAERIDERLITVRVNAMLSGLPVAPFRAPASEETAARSRTVILGVPCVTEEAFLAEAKYMADELGLLEKCKNPDAAYALYWGKLLYTDSRFVEALHYLTNAYGALAPLMEHPEEQSQATCETFYEVCYFLGVVNCALSRFHSAYYYLDLIVNQHRVMWTEQYVLCLMALHDPRCPSMIAGLLENVRKQRDDTEESDSDAAMQLNSFIQFLERQLIVLDIREGKIEEARRSLTELLAADPDNSFALYWLEQLPQQ